MLPDLLRQKRIRNQLDEVVDRVYGRMHGLEPLYFLSDRQRVVQQSRGGRPAARRRRRRHVVLGRVYSVTLQSFDNRDLEVNVNARQFIVDVL